MNGVTIKTSIVLALLKLVARLPLTVLYVLSDVMCLLLQHIIHYREKVVYGNLSRSFPEKDEAEIKQIANNFYRHLCDCVVETVKLLHISKSTMRERVQFANMALLEKAGQDGRPVVLYIGHLGNWELVQEITEHLETISIIGEIYRPLANKVMNRVMSTIRSRYPAIQIPQKKAVRTILDLNTRYKTFLVGFVADQRPTRHSLKHWTVFLGQDTPYMVGAENIGRHIGAAFFYLHISKPSRGHYIMTIKEMVPTPAFIASQQYPYTELYLSLLEENIKESPEIWLWSHNRWKHSNQFNKER